MLVVAVSASRRSAVIHFRSSSRMPLDPILPGLYLLCSRPPLLAAAAEGRLEPSPVRRFEGPSLISCTVTQNSRLFEPSVLLVAQSEGNLQPKLDLARGCLRGGGRQKRPIYLTACLRHLA